MTEQTITSTVDQLAGLGRYEYGWADSDVAGFGHLLLGTDEAVAPAAIVLGVVLALAGTQLSRRAVEAIGDAQFRNWSRRLIVAVAAVYLFLNVDT